jgi:hypothetical protein
MVRGHTGVWWAIAMLALCSGVASAGVIISIDDRGDGPPIFTFSGFGVNDGGQTASESADIHGEYLSLFTGLGNGQTISVNFNFVEPPGQPNAPGYTGFSDTLNIVFTGHTPTTADPNTISVDFHFRSDSDLTGLPGLANGISIPETGSFQDLSQAIFNATGITDFQVSVASDVVPEPATWSFMAFGIGGLALAKLRRRK